MKLLLWWDDTWALLRQRLRQATAPFDRRVPRERMTLLIGIAALALWAADTLWLTPAYQGWRTASQRLATARQQLEAQRSAFEQQRVIASARDKQLRGELQDWRQRVNVGAEGLRRFDTTLVRPEQMLALLEQMLPRDGRLKVRELRSLGSAEAGAALPGAGTTVPAAAPSAGVYRHGVEITLEGSYPDLVAYLQALEAMPQRLLWGGLAMKVERHPQVRMTLKLYTLSLDRGWLEL